MGGYPTLISGAASTDTDGDGMLDAFEDLHGRKKNSAADVLGDGDSDGYLNLEEFFNSTNPVIPEGVVNLKFNEPQGALCKDSSSRVNVGKFVGNVTRSAGKCGAASRWRAARPIMSL